MLVSAAQTSLPLLLLSDSRSVLATLSSPPSFLLSQTLWPIWQELFSFSFCSIRLQWVPGHSFLPESNATDELARRGALLAHSAIPCSLSPFVYHSDFFFLGLEAYSLIEVLRHTGSLDFHRGTCAPSSRSLCFLSSTLQRTQPTVKLLSLQDWQNPSCSTCVHSSQDSFHLILNCPATDSAPLVLGRLSVSTTSGPGPGEFPGFWCSMVFRHGPIPRKGSSGNSNNLKVGIQQLG